MKSFKKPRNKSAGVMIEEEKKGEPLSVSTVKE